MNKESKDKSKKFIMIISVIATLLITAMGTTSTTNANAFNFGLSSNDDNTGSIDTNSLFGCVGAAINCVNTNEENNNVIANNTSGNGNTNEEQPEQSATLIVKKMVTCDDVESLVRCDSVNSYFEPRDFIITVTGENQNPSPFEGSKMELT